MHCTSKYFTDKHIQAQTYRSLIRRLACSATVLANTVFICLVAFSDWLSGIDLQ